MATTSTIGLARAALVTTLSTGQLAGKVYFAWPGPVASKGSHELVWVDRVAEWSSQIPNIKAGRKQRQERYIFELVLWVAKPELDSDSAQAVFERALALLAVVENALADDVQLGQAALSWAVLGELQVDLVPYESGWGCQIIPKIEGNARLT